MRTECSAGSDEKAGPILGERGCDTPDFRSWMRSQGAVKDAFVRVRWSGSGRRAISLSQARQVPTEHRVLLRCSLFHRSWWNGEHLRRGDCEPDERRVARLP